MNKVTITFEGGNPQRLKEVCTDRELRRLLEMFGPERIQLPNGDGETSNVALAELKEPVRAKAILQGFVWNGFKLDLTLA